MRRPHGYWTKKENLIAEAKQAMQEQGWTALPSAHTLRARGYDSLINGSQKHGGVNSLRKLLNQEPLRRPPNYWKNSRNVIAEAKKAMQEQGWATLPSYDILRRHGYGQLVDGSKYHKGLPGLRKLLGQKEILQLENGLWASTEFMVQQAKKAMKDQGWTTLPGADTLSRNGYSSLVYASRYHGGMLALRKLLGEDRIRTKNGLWKNQEYIVQQTQQVMLEQGWTTLSGASTLEKLGFSSIVNAARKYHNGMKGLRKLLAEHSDQPSEQEQLEVLVGGYDA